MLSHKAGTRMTLSDRFKLIRQEQQNRKIMVNPLIESPNPDRVMKNYLNTVSDFGRPSAVLRKASERNRKLALQMANNVALMNEFNQRLILPEFPIGTLEMDKILPDVHSRLGLMRNRLNSSLGKGDIKSRLGRRPISQRLGLSQPLKSRKLLLNEIEDKVFNSFSFSNFLKECDRFQLITCNDQDLVKSYPKTRVESVLGKPKN
ncbi:hypothetical protein SSS_09553 [Sarcoptes scabiei]|nr:hypothetical protein SSS_09553 [Sarcoptes scabiei]